MTPLVRAAVCAVGLSALSRWAESRTNLLAAARRAAPISEDVEQRSSLCPDGTLPDGNVCIPVPAAPSNAASLDPEQNAHRDRSGRWHVYEQIPRRPERASDYRAYHLPVAALPGQAAIMSGYDLDLPDARQRRAPELSAVGHGGIDIAQRRGAEVRLVNLEHQVGNAEVLFVGPLFGNSVVTRHTLREAGELREYLVLYGHLEAAAPGLRRTLSLREGDLVGFVGDSGSPGIVHLHLEIRRVRREVNVAELAAGELMHNAKTVVCDPRNVLPRATTP